MLLVNFALFSFKIDVSEKSSGVLYAGFAVQELDLAAMNDIISWKNSDLFHCCYNWIVRKKQGSNLQVLTVRW
jgi:hypothetical protein